MLSSPPLLKLPLQLNSLKHTNKEGAEEKKKRTKNQRSKEQRSQQRNALLAIAKGQKRGESLDVCKGQTHPSRGMLWIWEQDEKEPG